MQETAIAPVVVAAIPQPVIEAPQAAIAAPMLEVADPILSNATAVEPVLVAPSPVVTPIAPKTIAATPVLAPTVQPEPSTATAAGLPKVQAYALPLDELTQIAQQSGLNWVNSDSAKVSAAQAAIAAEPKAARIPRIRPPVLKLDDRPLVLVETRRDLREMSLPFENTPQA